MMQGGGGNGAGLPPGDGRYMPPGMAEYPPMHQPHQSLHDPHLHYGSHPSQGARRTDLDMMQQPQGGSSDDDMVDVKPQIQERGAGRGNPLKAEGGAPTGKKTKGRVKIKMEFIDNKLRRYTTFSKRKTGIMKKAYELSTLTGTQVMLLVASETGHVYTFATRKLQPMITSDAGKALIQTCLNSPDPPPTSSDQRMSATGYEETELTYNVADDEQKGSDDPLNADDDDDEASEVEDQPKEATKRKASASRPVQSVQGSSRSNPSTSSASSLHVDVLQKLIKGSSRSNPSSASSLPPDVLQKLLSTGHILNQDGQLIQLVPVPASTSTSTTTMASSTASSSSPKPKNQMHTVSHKKFRK